MLVLNLITVGLEFGDAFASGGQLLLQLLDAGLLLVDHGLGAVMLGGGEWRAASSRATSASPRVRVGRSAAHSTNFFSAALAPRPNVGPFLGSRLTKRRVVTIDTLCRGARQEIEMLLTESERRREVGRF